MAGMNYYDRPDHELGGCMVAAFAIGAIGTLLAFALLFGMLTLTLFDLGKAVFNAAFPTSEESDREAAVTSEIHDRPLFTLEQQRQLVQDHRTVVAICGENVVFEWSGEFPEELKPFMWAYPE